MLSLVVDLHLFPKGFLVLKLLKLSVLELLHRISLQYVSSALFFGGLGDDMVVSDLSERRLRDD